MTKVDEYRAIAIKLRHEATFVHPDMRERKLSDAKIWDRRAIELEASGGELFHEGSAATLAPGAWTKLAG
jgi:hypothetical protein